MIAGGVTTRWPRPASPRRPDSVGIHAGAEIASMARHGAEPFEEAALVGGRLYLDVMQALVAGFVAMGCVRPNASITRINGPIGLMRRDLRLWLHEADPVRGGAVMTGRLGHNGGPALDAPADTRPGRCKHCRHWKAPSDEEQRAYEWFQLGLSRRRVKRPTGACDRVLVGNSRKPSFSATSAEFGCDNFEAAPPPPIPRGGGFVTIWREGGIAWQGREEEIPARFQQQDLDL